MNLETPAPPAWSEPEAPRPPQWRGAFASLGIGLAAALLGLLPWILTGMRLPLQAMWAFDAAAREQMPIAFLPLGNTTVTAVLGMLVVGWVGAAIAARALGTRLPSRAPFSIAAGLLLVQVVALAQSAQALDAGLPSGDRAVFYLVACVAVAVAGILIGLVAFGLVARAPRGGAMLGLVVGALALDGWFGAFFTPRGALPIELYSAVHPVLRWLPAILVGAAIAWAGLGTVRRIIAAVVSLLLLWVVPAFATAVTSAVGSRVLLRDPSGLVDQFTGVLRSAISMPGLVVPPLVVALAVAAAGLVLRRLLAQRVSSG